MNLSEVLNVALPELPAQRIGRTFPRLPPKLIAREQIEGGEPVIVVMVSGDGSIFRFSREQWTLAQLFNGERSLKEIAELYQQQTGFELGEEQVAEFANSVEESSFWYKTPLEKNITANQKLQEQRKSRRNKKSVDLAIMSLSAWDPDAFLTRVHNALRFAYSGWFTLLTLAAFAIMAVIFLSGWGEIWRDTVKYYTFTEKGAADLAEFWLLFCGLGFFHECAHGLTCKHYGGEVHRMGFMLVYLSPAFFCDVGEVYVYGGKWQRIAAIIAGIWVELMFCSAASILWWGTPVGSPVHDFAYKIMLITGVAVVLMNLNPLIKLDGYYLFGELIGISTLKESSTEYISSWIKRSLLRLPVDVPYLSPRRRWLFAIYAVLSGLYSYVVLFAIVRLVYNVSSHFNPQWAFLPALALALLIFRTRLRSSMRFMRDFYLDKKPEIKNWWTPRRKLITAAIALIIFFVPVWRETVSGRFVLESQQRAVLRAVLPAQITAVLTDEGTSVLAGTPLLTLRNVALEKETDTARTQLNVAQMTDREAQLKNGKLGQARAELASDVEHYQAVTAQTATLQVSSPIAGAVVTRGLRNLAGSFVERGAELVEIDNLTDLRARIFVPEFEMHRLRAGALVSLKLDSLFGPVRGEVNTLAPAVSEIAAGLATSEQYKGAVAPHYYVATVLVPNALGRMKPGMSGDAKILVSRRSAVGLCWEVAVEFVKRKLW